MKKLLLPILLAILLTACPDPTTPPAVTVPTDPTGPAPVYDFSGGVFKGPFLVGSTVSIYPLDENLDQTGISYSGDIVSDDGTYDISGIEVSGPIELVATGYYFDEIAGTVTDNQMTMRAITEDTGTVNINLFTALEYDRVKSLYSTGLSITEAKAQAIGEIFDAFGLPNYQDDSGDINIGTANGAELLTVSSLFAYGRSPAQVQQYITELRVDLADGVADVSHLTDSAKYIDAAAVKANLESYYETKMIAAVVPSFIDELYSLYGTNEITPDENNGIFLSADSTVFVDAGFGLPVGFIIPPATSLTFRITESAEYARFYTGGGFTASADLNEATAVGPGYFRLDNSILWGPSGYQFTITVLVNGVETAVVQYEIR